MIERLYKLNSLIDRKAVNTSTVGSTPPSISEAADHVAWQNHESYCKMQMHWHIAGCTNEIALNCAATLT